MTHRRIGIGDLSPAAVRQARAAVGGQLDWRRLADLHRPTDRDQLAAEIRRLRASGLMPRDISTALRIALPVVLEALADAPHTATRSNA
jgi:hypothetical protein